MIPESATNQIKSIATDRSIPPAWGFLTLGKLCKEIVGGGTPKRSRSDFFDGDIVWITPSDLDTREPTREVAASKTTLNKQGLESSSAKLVPPGTVLFSSRATIGKIAIIVARIEAFMPEIKKARQLLDQMRLDTGLVMEAALEHVFSKLSPVRQQLIDVLDGKPKNGWSPKCDDNLEGTPVLKLGAVLGFRYNSSAVKYTSLPVKPGAHYWLKKGDLLISRSNTHALVGHAAVYAGEPYPCIYPDLLMRMRVRSTQAYPKFIVYWLQGKEARRYITAKATGASSTMKKITQGDVCSLPFPKIDIKQQRQIVSYFATIEDKLNLIRRLQDQDAERIDRLEQSILERAFRGEL